MPAAVVSSSSVYSEAGPVVATNPDPSGSGTLLFISCTQGFGNAGTVVWTSPDAAATVIDSYDTTSGFQPQYRVWSLPNTQAATYTFGGDSNDERQTATIIALDQSLSALTPSASRGVSGSTTPNFPTLSGTLADDLILAVSLQQSSSEMTTGSAGYTEVLNTTDGSPNRIAVYSRVEDADGSEKPGGTVWSGGGAKVQFVLGARGSTDLMADPATVEAVVALLEPSVTLAPVAIPGRAEVVVTATDPTIKANASPVTAEVRSSLLEPTAIVTLPRPPVFPDARLDTRIEAAFGAQDNSPLEWDWTNISDGRLLAESLDIRRGRADESSRPQPSEVSFLLDNIDGEWTPHSAASSRYPYVERGLPIRITVGSAETALNIPGEDGGNATTPDSLALDLQGDIDLRVRFLPDQWALGRTWDAGVSTPPERQTLISKVAAGDYSWVLALQGAGFPDLRYSPDGLEVQAGGVLLEQAELTPMWLGATYSAATGVTSFYRSTEAVPPASILQWEHLGVEQGATTGPVHASAAPLEIGTTDGAASYRGRIFKVEIREGIDGVLRAAPDFADQPIGTTEFTDPTGLVWTINGGAEISDRVIRYCGQVSSVELVWPHGDNHPDSSVVPSECQALVSASGMLRRLTQGNKPLRSPFYRHAASPRNIGLLSAYWPMEDGEQAAQLGSAIPGHPAAILHSGVEPASDDSFLASGSLPSMVSDEPVLWDGAVVDTDGLSDGWVAQVAFNLPEPQVDPILTQVLRANTTGTVARWTARLNDTVLLLRGYNNAGVTIVDSAAGLGPSVFNSWQLFRLEIVQNGPNIEWSWVLGDIDLGVVSGVSGTLVGDIGLPTSIGAETTGPKEGLAFGHAMVHAPNLQHGWLAGADTAWVGESADHRIWRLCQEEGVPIEIIGGGANSQLLRGSPTVTEAMGPQGTKPLVDLLFEAARLDYGVLSERPRSPGLQYRTRRTIENQTPWTLDGSVSEFANPLRPVMDDQRYRNSITVKSAESSFATALNSASVTEQGLYEEEIELAGIGGVDVQNAILGARPELVEAVKSQNLNQASWRLAFGDWPKLRYPAVTLDFNVAPWLIEGWHQLALGDAIRLVGLPAQHPSEVVDLVVEGISERMAPTGWRPVLTCSLGGPWQLGALGEGQSGNRLEAGSTTLASSVGVSDTVFVLEGDRWVSDPAEFPISVLIAGELVTVGGASSGNIQSLTGVTRSVNGVTVPHEAGAAVTVVDPIRLSLGVDDPFVPIVATTPDPDPDPDPDPTGTKIPSSQLSIDIDPDDASTFGVGRSAGQLIGAGQIFNPSDTAGDSLSGKTPLTYNATTNEIHSFTADDGQTLRWGAVSDAGTPGKVLLQRHQFKGGPTPLGDNSYDAANNHSPRYGGNGALDTSNSDELFHDGTRTQLAFLPQNAVDPFAITVGPGGDRFMAATGFRVEQWMVNAQDQQSTVLSLHAIGAGSAGPMSTAFIAGRFQIATRDSTSAWATGDSHPPTTVRYTTDFTNADVGDYWGIVFDLQPDPVGGSGHYRMWINKGGAGWNQVVNHSGNWGWWWGSSNPGGNNDLFYPIAAKIYNFHQYDLTGVDDDNWDQNYPVRTMRYSHFAAAINPPAALTAADFRGHVDAYHGWAT